MNKIQQKNPDNNIYKQYGVIAIFILEFVYVECSVSSH